MAKPNLALIPATIGDKVYSILPSDGVGDFDFDRADGSSPTGVTRINAQGLIETVASGENRLNYSLLDGEVVGCPHLLLEPSRTNLVTYSEDFSLWSKTGSTSVSSNDNISPDGTLNASTVSGLTGSGSNDLRLSLGINPANKTYTFSVYLKGTGTLRLHLSNNVDNTASNIVTLTSSWVRYELTHTFNSTSATLSVLLDDSGATATGYKVWGAQLEEGSFPTSYIKTTSASVTRAAETCNGSGNAATFNDSEGVLMVEASSLSELDVTARYIQVSDGTSTPNGIQLRYYTTTNSLQALYYTNSAYQAILGYTLPNSSENNKIAFKYKENDFALWVNGLEVGTDTNGLVGATLSQLKFDYNNFSDFYGKTKQLQYFDTTDIDLEQLTSWDSFRAMAEGQLYTIE